MLKDKAEKFARKCHEGQYRKDGVTPYIVHPEAVVNNLKEIGVLDDDMISAAWLHDTVEDCGVSIGFLEDEFNKRIAFFVKMLTRDTNKEKYRDRIMRAEEDVQIIKLADALHNSSTLFEGLPERTIRNVVWDCKYFYIPLAKELNARFYELLKQNIKPWESFVDA